MDPSSAARMAAPLSPDEVATLLRGLIGQHLPGGCDDCTAWHEYIEDVPGIFDNWIHHQETCPQLRPADVE